MEDPKPAKVVPSGKVYRQIFDAEVQLVNTLEAKQDERQRRMEQEKSPKGEKRIPVVHESRGAAPFGMLTERQRTWLEGFPNEYLIENPVTYRHDVEEHALSLETTESLAASREVRGLPDVLTPVKTGSDIIERIADSRKQRHEAAVEDMHQELGVISSDLEPRIVEASEILLSNLADNDIEIESLLVRIETDEKLLMFSLSDLESLWLEIAAQSVIRQEWIQELDSRLHKAEEDRIEMIRDVLLSYAQQLKQISHLMAPDLQRLLSDETQAINQVVLTNKRAYADLCARLMIGDIEREKKQHTLWKNRIEDWRELNTQAAVNKFREFMQSDFILKPPGADKVLTFMMAEQETLNKKRLELLNSLREMRPPGSTKTAVYQWNQQITEVSKQIDNRNQQYFNQLYAEYEKVCQQCLEEADKIKADLMESGICTEAKAQDVLNEQCLPMVGEQQAKFENILEEMDKNLEDHNQLVVQQLKSLFKFAQGAAHVWDVHEIGLAKQERALQEKLENCRHAHDSVNQDKEANLDIIMDRMRQEGSEQGLKECLKKALEMMSTLKNGYEDFQRDQLEIVQSYPDMVAKELMSYDAGICKFYGVDRLHPDEILKKEEQKRAEEEEEAAKVKSKQKKRSKRPGSRSSSQASDTEGGKSDPLPLAISEVLSTAKGTTFYVLTVAGEHGVPAEPKEGASEKKTFLTEDEIEDVPNKPPYVQTVDLPAADIVAIKTHIRLNFLNHMEEWMEQAIDRANSVVSAKTEELNSELDLRLHLHQPRPRRAELDVHNVRAAELVMHSERVSRHTKGINQAISELKTRFSSMTKEHNKLVENFRKDILALEVVFVNATKSAKLLSLSNQLQKELDKFMNIIRTSLRQFRQHLDETLQMLRDSNARFIKSFKLFSDGGNFCPSEIDDYRKKLEKMAQKIDAAEGFIMSDLEGMESKRLDQGTKIAAEFEDRFKHHMIDLVFMEKIARWLTNTQVKIKSEVADSNKQAQTLMQYLTDLERRIDACERPNLDKEQITPQQLNNSLKIIFESFYNRSVYLDCLKDPNSRPTSSTMQGAPSLGARVAFISDQVPPISRPGKQPSEDPSVAVIKNILKVQKKRLGIEAEEESGHSPHHGTDGRDKKSNASRPPTQGDSKSKSSSRKGTATTTTLDTPKRTMSGLRRASKGAKFDKKYLIYGERGEENEERHFLGKITHVLRETLDGLLTAAELYYRQKGIRVVTRPQALQDNFDACAETVVQKLQSYYKQADEYHNQCLQELRGQLSQLETLVAHVPPLVINEVLKISVQKGCERRKEMDNEFGRKLDSLDSRKFEHQHLLRPTLGHPRKAAELEELTEKENCRRQEYLDGVKTHTETLQKTTMDEGKAFIQDLSKMSEMLLLQFDNMLTVDDVLKGRAEATKYPTSELIRRKNDGIPLEDDQDTEAMPRGKGKWTGIPKNELVVGKIPSKPSLTASVTTAKTTLGHTSSVTARDSAYQNYKDEFAKALAEIEDHRVKHVIAEDRWTDSWKNSVEKIRELYM